MNFEIIADPWTFLNASEDHGFWGWIQFVILFFLYQYFVFAERGVTIKWLIVIIITINLFFAPYILKVQNYAKSTQFIELVHTLIFFIFYGFLIYIITCRRFYELTTIKLYSRHILLHIIVLLIFLFSWIIPSFLLLGWKLAKIITYDLKSER